MCLRQHGAKRVIVLIRVVLASCLKPAHVTFVTPSFWTSQLLNDLVQLRLLPSYCRAVARLFCIPLHACQRETCLASSLISLQGNKFEV